MPYYLKYILTILERIPWVHWAVIGFFTLLISLVLLFRKKSSAYGAITCGLSFLVGFFILEMAIVVRYFGIMPHRYGVDLFSGFVRIFQSGEPGRREIISNIAIFIPFGFFLSEFLSVTKSISTWRRIGDVALIAFGLSLFVECFQLILHVGFFELSDLLMNSVGAFIGAIVSMTGRALLGRKRCQS